MGPIRIPRNYRISSESFDNRVGQMIVYMAGIAIVPMAIVALVRHPGSQADFLLGLGLACLLALLLVMLGMLCGQVGGIGDKLALRSRLPEFASYAVCMAIMITGIQSLAHLGLTPAQITVGLLLICA